MLFNHLFIKFCVFLSYVHDIYIMVFEYFHILLKESSLYCSVPVILHLRAVSVRLGIYKILSRASRPGGRFPPTFIHQVILITGLNKLYNCMFSP